MTRSVDDIHRLILREAWCPDNVVSQTELFAEIMSNPNLLRRYGAVVVHFAHKPLITLGMRPYGSADYTVLKNGSTSRVVRRATDNSDVVMKFVTHTHTDDIRRTATEDDLTPTLEMIHRVEEVLPELVVPSMEMALKKSWLTADAAFGLEQQFIEGVSVDDIPVLNRNQADKLRTLAQNVMDTLVPEGYAIDVLAPDNIYIDQEGALRLVDTIPHTENNPNLFNLNCQVLNDMAHLSPGTNLLPTQRRIRWARNDSVTRVANE